ncbi:MAG: hypothetical protein IPH42_16825 [Bacteroidetes bacterium]|nr:hypothetical protein [Bacteroidota bacterium]
MPIVKEIGIASKLTGGLLLYNDVSGDGNLTNLSVMASTAFVLGLGGRENHNLSLGFARWFNAKIIGF